VLHRARRAAKPRDVDGHEVIEVWRCYDPGCYRACLCRKGSAAI
jgi:hypothetical protein